MDAQKKKSLQAHCRNLRRNIIRMTHAAGSGHPGGSLSSVEILVALYFHEMRHRVEEPEWADRDRFVLSKGHGCPALYAVLAEAGYISPDLLTTLRKLDSPLQGHPDRRKFPLAEASTGSLGMGLSIGIGMALGLARRKSPARVFCLMGDGEMDEGQVWEAAMFAPARHLDNLVAIGDMNGAQNDDFVEKILPQGDVPAKWRAFGWHVVEVDGHDVEKVALALEGLRDVKGKPKMIVAKTVKGKGVSFMENVPGWHGQAPSDEQAAKALAEIDKAEVR